MGVTADFSWTVSLPTPSSNAEYQDGHQELRTVIQSNSAWKIILIDIWLYTGLSQKILSNKNPEKFTLI